MNSQKALDTPKTITLSILKDQLIITNRASCRAIGATMSTQRDKNKLISGFFYTKLSKKQLNWTPCHCDKSVRIRSYSCILRISPYSVRMRENAYKNDSEYEHFLRSA